MPDIQPQDSEALKLRIGSAIAHGTYLNDSAREEEFVGIMKDVRVLINSEVRAVLSRLKQELDDQKTAAQENLKYHTEKTKNERLIRDWQGTVHGIEFCRPAIEAEESKYGKE